MVDTGSYVVKISIIQQINTAKDLKNIVFPTLRAAWQSDNIILGLKLYFHKDHKGLMIKISQFVLISVDHHQPDMGIKGLRKGFGSVLVEISFALYELCSVRCVQTEF